MIVDARMCSNCRRLVPHRCDGRLYRIEEFSRPLCRGRDGESFRTVAGVLVYHYVRGHGQEWDVPLTPVPG